VSCKDLGAKQERRREQVSAKAKDNKNREKKEGERRTRTADFFMGGTPLIELIKFGEQARGAGRQNKIGHPLHKRKEVCP
jgi:hypothetical protein